MDLFAPFGLSDERVEVALILRQISEQIVEIVLDASDIVEVRRGIEKITVEKGIEEMKGIDVLLLFDVVAHERRLQIDVRFLSLID